MIRTHWQVSNRKVSSASAHLESHIKCASGLRIRGLAVPPSSPVNALPPPRSRLQVAFDALLPIITAALPVGAVAMHAPAWTHMAAEVPCVSQPTQLSSPRVVGWEGLGVA